MSYIYLLFTILLTCYGQIVVKWRMPIHGQLPHTFNLKIAFILSLLLDPFIISSLFAAVIASLCYMSALSKLPLSHAYPFMGATFGIVLIGSSIFLNEPLNCYKIFGVIMIVIGIAVGSQG